MINDSMPDRLSGRVISHQELKNKTKHGSKNWMVRNIGIQLKDIC